MSWSVGSSACLTMAFTVASLLTSGSSEGITAESIVSVGHGMLHSQSMGFFICRIKLGAYMPPLVNIHGFSNNRDSVRNEGMEGSCFLIDVLQVRVKQHKFGL